MSGPSYTSYSVPGNRESHVSEGHGQWSDSFSLAEYEHADVREEHLQHMQNIYGSRDYTSDLPPQAVSFAASQAAQYGLGNTGIEVGPSRGQASLRTTTPASLASPTSEATLDSRSTEAYDGYYWCPYSDCLNEKGYRRFDRFNAYMDHMRRIHEETDPNEPIRTKTRPYPTKAGGRVEFAKRAIPAEGIANMLMWHTDAHNHLSKILGFLQMDETHWANFWLSACPEKEQNLFANQIVNPELYSTSPPSDLMSLIWELRGSRGWLAIQKRLLEEYENDTRLPAHQRFSISSSLRSSNATSISMFSSASPRSSASEVPFENFQMQPPQAQASRGGGGNKRKAICGEKGIQQLTLDALEGSY